jgi:hypothetical protein
MNSVFVICRTRKLVNSNDRLYRHNWQQKHLQQAKKRVAVEKLFIFLIDFVFFWQEKKNIQKTNFKLNRRLLTKPR